MRSAQRQRIVDRLRNAVCSGREVTFDVGDAELLLNMLSVAEGLRWLVRRTGTGPPREAS